MTERTHNFTGKSDFFDWCNAHSDPDTIVKYAEVYLNDARVAIKESRDLIPYYTHIIATLCKSEGKQVIHLSKESYLDSHEKERISYYVKDAIIWAKKARREKKDFDLSFVKTQKEYQIFYSSVDDCLLNSIINRINNYPEIIKFPISKKIHDISLYKNYIVPNYFYNIHDREFTLLREEFVKYAKENGFATFFWDDVSSTVTGEYHPIIWEMCKKIADYHKMENEGVI